jgi:hypothetical protein
MDSWARIQAYAKQAGRDPYRDGTLTSKQGRRYVKKYWRDQKKHEKWLEEITALAKEGATAADLRLAEWELELLMREPGESA